MVLSRCISFSRIQILSLTFIQDTQYSRRVGRKLGFENLLSVSFSGLSRDYLEKKQVRETE